MYTPGFGGGYNGTAPNYPLKHLSQRRLETLLDLSLDVRALYAIAIQYAQRCWDQIAPSNGVSLDSDRYLKVVAQASEITNSHPVGLPKDTVRFDHLALRLKQLIDEARIPSSILPHVFDELTAMIEDRKVAGSTQASQ